MSYWDWGYYKPKPRIKTRGGIKSQSKRGSFGQSWWAKRWIAVLESFNIGARLGRGRSYARSGQVLSIDISKGLITSKVQGSRTRPYEIIINVKTLTDADWERLAGSLSTQAIFAAKLLAGEMPQEIEAAFTEQKLSLFPEKLRDLETNCSCPDWSNPCKHIAAVYYLLGEEFDRDPFLIFKLRGATRDEFIKLLGASGVTPTSRGLATEELPSSSEPLTTNGTDYWNGEQIPDDFFGDVRLPPVSAAGPKRLGNFPFWRGSEQLLEAIEPVYKQVSQFGLNLFLGEREPPSPQRRRER
ncbi:MAG: SWIM zinc finger family protein [Acidobacteria bacterium]|nr:SWIM zinc finger family protein [Acidobacteriota bacterium]